jgi:nicotinamide mononucleotide transporter
VTTGDFFDTVAALTAGVSPMEATGAVLGILYVLLAVRQIRWCWVFAFVSTALYLGVFARTGLVMQAGLQAFFLAIAVYGWLSWSGPTGARPRVTQSWPTQVVALVIVLAVSEATARVLASETQSVDPRLDAISTWASVYATWLQARKVRQNWLWWIGIDLLIAWLCARHGLYLSALLYGLFVVLAGLGWREWSRESGPQ